MAGPNLLAVAAEAEVISTGPSARAAPDARSTLREWLGRKAFYGAGSAVLAQRHGKVLAPAVLAPSYAVAASALQLRKRWSVPVAALALARGTRSVQRVLVGRRLDDAAYGTGLWWGAIRIRSLTALMPRSPGSGRGAA